MAKYDWNTSRNYVAFLAGELAPGTRRPHHDSELTSCYHDAFLPWDLCHKNIVLFYHDSPITRSHFLDPTDRAIKGFYCNMIWSNKKAQSSKLWSNSFDSYALIVSRTNLERSRIGLLPVYGLIWCVKLHALKYLEGIMDSPIYIVYCTLDVWRKINCVLESKHEGWMFIVVLLITVYQ